MNAINKQKFLAELGKLLTFMYEEDRQTALAMYVKMFEDAEDEQALIQALLSPTRQAVIIARAYNARARKLQVESHTREELGEEAENETTPDYILAIDEVYQAAVPARTAATAPLKDQFSLFDAAAFEEEEEDEDGDSYDEDAYEEDEDGESGEPLDEEDDAYDEEDEPLTDEEDDFGEEPEELPDEQPEIGALDDPGEELEPEDAGAEPAPDEESGAPDGEPAEPLPIELTAAAEDADAPADEMDELLRDYARAEEEEAEALAEELILPEGAPAVGEELLPDEDVYEEVYEEDDEEDYVEDEPYGAAPAVSGETVRRVRPGILILYLIFAIPLTLLGIAVLLIPTLLCLALAVGVIAAGLAAVSTAFSGFPVFADIMIVIGAALIILALGLLFLWLFFWFIGGAIVGLVRAVVALGGRWCTKEVPA
ncbi:MAG: hypothetical protein IJ594_01860 [Oscillospiraceae bacterium]|nr:hypothetical protein [Oscillospiraceae bacterium]